MTEVVQYRVKRYDQRWVVESHVFKFDHVWNLSEDKRGYYREFVNFVKDFSNQGEANRFAYSMNRREAGVNEEEWDAMRLGGMAEALTTMAQTRILEEREKGSEK